MNKQDEQQPVTEDLTVNQDQAEAVKGGIIRSQQKSVSTEDRRVIS